MVQEMQHLTGNDALEKIRELLKHFRSAMMVTHDGDEHLHVRPMAVQGEPRKFEGDLWFFTSDASAKVREIANDSSVSLIFQNDGQDAYLHLIGEAAIVKDRGKMKELYTPILQTWFPQGVEDPRMALIRFRADHGDFWDNPAGILRTLAAFTKAVVTGTPGQGGEVGDLQL